MINYTRRIGIAISVLINVLLGGSSNQTFSARNYELKRSDKPNLVWIIDKFFFYQQNHCMMSWLYWRVRKDVIHEYDQSTKEYDNG